MENKTAVEFYISEKHKLDTMLKNNEISVAEHSIASLALMGKSKQLEKEQIERTFNESRKTYHMIGFKWESFDEYYKETFKSK